MENERHGRAPDMAALWRLKTARRSLTRHQYRTLRGQIIAGDAAGAMRGLDKLLKRHTDTVEQKNNVSRQTPEKERNQ